MNDKTQIGLIYEKMNKVTLVDAVIYRDGGSVDLTFSDGLKCLYDNGIGSKTKGEFVETWKNRIPVNISESHINALLESEGNIEFPYKKRIKQ